MTTRLLPLTWVLGIDKEQDPAYHEKGVALARSGRYKDAVTAFSDAISLDNGKPETHYEKGRALFELGHDEEAITTFGRVLELKPRLLMLPISWVLHWNTLAGTLMR